MSTDDILNRARQALEGVTEGPWEAQDWTSHANGERGCGILAGVGLKQRGIAWTGQYHWNPEDEAQADAEFIAASRTLVPELVAELSRLRACETQLRALAEGDWVMVEDPRDYDTLKKAVWADDILAVLDREDQP